MPEKTASILLKLTFNQQNWIWASLLDKRERPAIASFHGDTSCDFRMARVTKTGKSSHPAFKEFSHDEE
jgi:hypothetical protein